MKPVFYLLLVSSLQCIQGFWYEKLDNGARCAGTEAARIKDKKECEVGVTYLGLARTSTYEGNWARMPPGCYIQESRYQQNSATVYFNINKRGTSASHKYKSICRQGPSDCEYKISVHQSNMKNLEDGAYPFFGPRNYHGNPHIYGDYRQQPGLYNGHHWWLKDNDSSLKIFMAGGDWVISTAGLVGHLPQTFQRSPFNTMAFSSAGNTCPEDIFFQWNYYNADFQAYKPAGETITVYGASGPHFHAAHNPQASPFKSSQLFYDENQ